MSVTLGDGKSYKAEPAASENYIKIKKEGTEEVVSISEVKKIDFSDEKDAEGKKTDTASVEIPADIKAILEKVPDKSKFPNAGGYVIEDEDIYKLNEDGTYKIRSHYIFKIFEDRAVDSGITLSYAFERESIKIAMARTILEDGRVYNLDPKDIKEGDAFQGSQFYSNTYKMVSATLPNVKKGAIIEYVIEHNVFKPLIEGYFCPSVYFASSEPKLHCRTEIRVPKNKKIKYVAKNFDRIYDKNFEILKPMEKPQIKEEGNETVYIFDISNVPEMISEAFMPNYKDVTPRIQFSAYESWDKMFEWFNDKFDRHVSEVSDQMKAKVEEITKKCKTKEDKIAALYHYIQQENRYISIKGDVVSGLSGHPAKRTFDNKYGDCVDKAILMAAMMKLIGVDCYPTILNAGGGTMDEEVAHFYLNHSISFLKYDSKEIFLDSTSQDSRFPFFRSDDHDRNNLVSQLKRIVRAPMPVSKLISNRDVTIKDDGGIIVKGRREYEGQYEQSIRGYNKSLKEEEIKDNFKQSLNATLPGVKLISLEYTDFMDLTRQVVENVEYEAPNAVIIAGDLMLFAVPGYGFNFSEISLKERKYPIDYGYLTDGESTFNFTLPKGYKVKYLPKKFEVDNKYMNFKAEYRETAPGVITFADRTLRKCRFVDPADYASYKADLESIMKFAGEKAVIEKTSK
ncbi:MAG TPA: DUF3857 domain-containing protein [Candidatus Wallbacteria bacterium]|nr:DUF3857 domain-containing protein [Candidatus Wallbacteria bacterium]